MSGATSSTPSRGAIQARQRTVPCRTASSGMGQAVRIGVAVPEADGDERVCRVLLERRLVQEVDEGPLGPGLLEPAERDGGRAPVRDLLVGQRGEQVVDQLVTAQRLLHLGIQALPTRGRAMLDGHHRPDRQVAQGGVGVEQVRQQRRERFAAGQPAQRLHHGRGAAARRPAAPGARAPRPLRRSPPARGWPDTGARARLPGPKPARAPRARRPPGPGWSRRHGARSRRRRAAPRSAARPPAARGARPA